MTSERDSTHDQDEPDGSTQGERGDPSQTGPGSGTGMGTEEGSGWKPKGGRFGDDAGEQPVSPQVEPDEQARDGD